MNDRKPVAIGAYAALIIEEIVRRSHFCDFPFFETLCSAIMVVCCGVAAIKLGLDVYQKKLDLKGLLVIATGFLYSAFLVLRGQSDAFMVLWLFTAALHDCGFEKIVKVAALSMFAALILVYMSSTVGIIENTVETRMREEVEYNRNGVGFLAAYQAAYFLFFATLSWGYYRREKISWYEIITLAVFNYVVYWQSDTRGPYYLSVLLIGILVVLKLVPELTKHQKFYTWVAVLMPLLCTMVIIVQGCFFNPNGSEFLRELNVKFSSRLGLNYGGVHQYGFSFLGKPIEWSIGEKGAAYNWVDSVYLYSLLSYGIPFMLGFFAVTTKMALLAGKKKDTYMIIALVLVAILGLWDNYCFRVECNPFYLFLSYAACREPEAEEAIGFEKDPLTMKNTLFRRTI